MKSVFILQRSVPHYRVPIFNMLYEKYGYRVISASNFPEVSGGVNPQKCKGMLEEAFYFPHQENPFMCHVPLFRIWRKYNPEILILEAGTKMSSTWIALIWLMLPKFMRPQIVFWMHGKAVSNHSGIKSFLAKTIKKIQLCSADGVLTYTQSDVDYLEGLVSSAVVVSANNTIDIEPMKKLAEEVSPIIETEAPVWLCVGRLTRDKKIADVVSIFKGFLKNHSAAQLYIVGEGEERLNIEQEAGDFLEKNIHLIGAVYQEEKIAQYYNAADVFVLAGAAGIGVVHALAYGLPVVAFKEDEQGQGPHHHPEADYIVDGVTGWLVDDFSIEAMQKKLEEIFESKISPREILKLKIKSYVEKNLSISSMTKSFFQLVQKIT